MAVTATQALPETSVRSVTILGSTGSVGCNTVDLLRRNGEAFRVEALTANRNVDLLARQARLLGARMAVVADETRYGDLKAALAGSGIEAAAGAQALVEAAERPAEWVMASIVGAAGLMPTLAAVRRGAIIGLANKECLVCAGELMMAEIRRCGATVVPVDSEHSAIYQVFDFANADKVDSLILTASGGPFRTLDLAQMRNVTPAQAVAHPNWDMGAKISVDSATMMNKGLELIEAFHLFPVTAEQLEVVVHPQSIVHSLVSYVDGSVLAQLGSPDMRTPIAYALGWPNRIPAPAAKLRLGEIGALTFYPPDPDRFPALRIAREALRRGGAAAIVLNAANEVAVGSFLAGEIGFLSIAQVVEETIYAIDCRPVGSIDDVRDVDGEARAKAEDIIANLAQRIACPV
ncbi:MAG: 1-deoxy-D-xylulose-5-phosphate reductoisomerase [Rhodospirillales bacterium]|nr:1-deoxy-D-xylulose-5-phosphate reductoisomerase [Rhodospirillales bacterium]